MSIPIILHHFQKMLKSNQASSPCSVICIEVMHLLFNNVIFHLDGYHTDVEFLKIVKWEQMNQ